MTTHKGSCHCGQIAYEFDGDVGEAMDCNCSFCVKRGALLHFIPASAFRLSTPRGALATYKFNKHVIDHHFCKVCGIGPFAEGKGPGGQTMVAINMRCVDGVDLRALKITFHNGRDQ